MTHIDILKSGPNGYEHQWNAEVKESYDDLKESCNQIGIIPAAFYVVRTNTWKNFAKDLILPTIINHALKVENFVEKIFELLRALILDILGSPFRLLSAPYMIYSNSKKGETPLFKVLMNKLHSGEESGVYGSGFTENLIKSEGHALILFRWYESNPTLTYHWVLKHMNFIDAPIHGGLDNISGINTDPFQVLKFSNK